MAHVDIVLRPPPYGWADENGELVQPSNGQILKLFASRLNVFASRKQWLPATFWFNAVFLACFAVAFFVWYFSFKLLFVAFVYSMFGMGSHGTVWYHRYGTHRAFEFSHPFWKHLTRNLVLKQVPEEIYIISHFVHHSKSDQPGDPYNPKGGFLYCFLAGTIHQPIAHDLTEAQYQKTCSYVAHTGLSMNTYEQYQTWGTIAHPAKMWVHQVANWAFWGAVFWLIGGPALVCAIFGGAFAWVIGVRTFNFGAHGSGHDQRVDGEDFYRGDMSINQFWPGIVSGEWHNNHHLFANSARSGFKWWQLDIPYYYIRVLHAIGGVSTYRDRREEFFKKHYEPWLAAKAAAAGERPEGS